MRARLVVWIAFMALAGACRPTPGQTRQGQFALRFAEALSTGRYEEAHGLLSKDLALRMPAAALKTAYEEMVAYGAPGTANVVEVMQAMSFWPARKPGDVGWAYVAIAGDSFSEGIAVVVAEEAGRQVIRDIEWGRP